MTTNKKKGYRAYKVGDLVWVCGFYSDIHTIRGVIEVVKPYSDCEYPTVEDIAKVYPKFKNEKNTLYGVRFENENFYWVLASQLRPRKDGEIL